MIAPYIPAWEMLLGTEMKAIPTYNLIKLAAVVSNPEDLNALFLGVMCLFVRFEFENLGHASLGF